MNVAALATRLYTRTKEGIAGFRADDFLPPLMKDGIHVVSPIKPPEKSEAGVILTIDPEGFPGSASLAFQVVAAAHAVPDGALRLRRSDVVVLRNAHLEPLQPDMALFAIKAEHVLSILPEDSGTLDDAHPDIVLPLIPPLRLVEKTPEMLVA